eukprot:CAMPEP_0119290470 /NCGR_PEP_ID=MMETSP1329-20130426/40768_1 /TAXON_ID=114041 /ORGANISM="Genus nov. species nov., Strain RCC1024" /LENGTH=292 /DNA_ID=CAMNT_0007291291 /DNA_START=10 /DNA_END=885 /DNA_ORIENTATION=+
MFHSSASFQLANLLLILFISLIVQMRNMPYSSPSLADEVLRQYPERVAQLFEEEKASANYKDKMAAAARANRKLTFMMNAARKKQKGVAAKYVFEYNTVEAVLLSCAVLICLFGVMLDSDYLENGKHPSTRQALTYSCLFLIVGSLLYFAAVVYHEIVVVVFPWCKFYKQHHREDTDEDMDTEGMEMAEGNFAARAGRASTSHDANLMDVEEQLKLKALLKAVQDDNRKLKKQLGEAKSKGVTVVDKKKTKKTGWGVVAGAVAGRRRGSAELPEDAIHSATADAADDCHMTS